MQSQNTVFVVCIATGRLGGRGGSGIGCQIFAITHTHSAHIDVAGCGYLRGLKGCIGAYHLSVQLTTDIITPNFILVHGCAGNGRAIAVPLVGDLIIEIGLFPVFVCSSNTLRIYGHSTADLKDAVCGIGRHVGNLEQVTGNLFFHASFIVVCQNHILKATGKTGKLC